VGEVGERELEGSVTGRSAKRDGSYLASASTMSVEFVPVANLRTEFTGAFATYDIAGVTGFADQHYAAPAGLSADIRYRFLDRASAPFGFALGAEPHWGRADEVTGEPGNQYGVDFVAAADWEIVPNRVVAAFNLLYEPETLRSNLTGTWSAESTAGVAIGVMAQLGSGIFVGGEARYCASTTVPRWMRSPGRDFHRSDDLRQALRKGLDCRRMERASGRSGDVVAGRPRFGQFRAPAGAAVVRREFLKRRDGPALDYLAQPFRSFSSIVKTAPP